MNKKLITVAIAAGLALPMVSAHSAEVAGKKVELYGKFHMNAGKYDSTGTTKDNFKVESFDSRWGIKGKIALDGGLMGTYQVESKIVVDNGGSSTSGVAKDQMQVGNRTTYLGLKGGFGEVRIGYHDSPLKLAQGKFDQFGDTKGDLKNAGSQDAEHRNKNSITYLGKFNNVGVNVQMIPGEGDGITGGQGLTDTTSLAVTYKSGPLYVALANDAYDSKTGAGSETGMTRLVATYKMNDMQFGLLSQSGVEKVAVSADKETWLGLSFNMKMGSNNKFKAQYITVKDNAATVTTTNQMTFGIDHKLGKKGTVYAMYNTVDATGTASDSSSISAGYILKF